MRTINDVSMSLHVNSNNIKMLESIAIQTELNLYR